MLNISDDTSSAEPMPAVNRKPLVVVVVVEKVLEDIRRLGR